MSLPPSDKPEPEYVVRLSHREIVKLEYMVGLRKRQQAKRNREEEAVMLEDIEEKLKRARLLI